MPVMAMPGDRSWHTDRRAQRWVSGFSVPRVPTQPPPPQPQARVPAQRTPSLPGHRLAVTLACHALDRRVLRSLPSLRVSDAPPPAGSTYHVGSELG